MGEESQAEMRFARALALAWPILLALVMLGLEPASGAAPDLEWPVYRHDVRYTGASMGKGIITKPTVAWDYYLGPPRVGVVSSAAAREQGLGDLDGDGRRESVSAWGRTLAVRSEDGQVLWTHEFEEDGFADCRMKVGDIIPERPGLEVACSSGHMDTGYGRAYLFGFDKGAAQGELIWATDDLKSQYAPCLALGDVDGDGSKEIVLSPHYRVQVLEGRTGAVKYEAPWEVGRNYGLLLVQNIDQDPGEEVIIVCDFVLHVDMLKFDDGQPRHVWGERYMIPDRGGTREKFLHVGPSPLQDLDGDGRFELAYNLLNDHGDNEWHLVIRDAATGEVRADSKGWWLWGLRDLNRDGVCEMICSRTQAKRPARFDRLRLLQWRGGRLRTAWHGFNLAVPRQSVAMPESAATIAEDGTLTPITLDMDADGQEELLLQAYEGDATRANVALAIGADASGRFGGKWRTVVSNADLDLLSCEGAPGAVVLRARDLVSGDLVTLRPPKSDAEWTAGGQPGGFVTTPICADLERDGMPEILLQNSRAQILALHAPRAGAGQPEVVWSRDGHAMNYSPGYGLAGTKGVAAGDVDADGRLEVFFAGVERDGTESLLCADASGKVRWRHVFEGTPSGGLEAGVDLWVPGRFTGREGQDVWVSFHRLSRGSGECAVLDGRTGELVWHLREVEAPTGGSVLKMPAGDGLSAVFDANGDGAEDALNAHWIIYSVLSGRDGTPVFPSVAMTDAEHFGRWVAYSTPVPADLNGDGRTEVFLSCASYARGAYAAMTLEGKPIWSNFVQNDEGSSAEQAVVDVDGDGVCEIAADCLDGTLRCYSGADGSLRWKRAIGAGATDIAAADINSDGAIEFILRTGDGVLRAFRGTDGEQVWELAVGGCGNPVLADCDADGLLEVLLVGADGRLKAIDEGSR